jgi:hypothetical protein
MHYLEIDWATEKHDLCLFAENGSIIRHFSIAVLGIPYAETYRVMRFVHDGTPGPLPIGAMTTPKAPVTL